MKENLEFKNLREMYEEMPPDKRPEDILIDGKSIFEQPKTPAQIEIIKTSYRLVEDHLKKLNVENKPFDQKRIVFLPQKLVMNDGEYHDGDFFAVDESSEANLGTIVHELIHAQSAEWRNYDEEEVEKFLKENNKSVKSGFHRHSNFKTINEGITEKIAREIVNNNPDEYDKLKPLFEGRMEQALAERERKFRDEILPNKIKQREQEIAEDKERFEKLKQELTKEITEIDQEIFEAKTEREKELLTKIKENYERRLKEDPLEIGKIFDPVEHAHKVQELKIQGIEDDYNFTPHGMTSYDFNIEIINSLVEGIAKYNLRTSNNESELDNEKEKVWQDLQKAYFAGNTMYLRKIDETFGKGFLRHIDKLHQLLHEKEQGIFLEEIKSKVESI